MPFPYGLIPLMTKPRERKAVKRVEALDKLFADWMGAEVEEEVDDRVTDT